jgi:hypothetical protein
MVDAGPTPAPRLLPHLAAQALLRDTRQGAVALGDRAFIICSGARITVLAANIEWILLITGLATAGVLVLSLAPVPVMKLLFGQAPSDALSLLIARHWGLLVCLVGAQLIYAAYHAEVRVPTLIIAIVEKVALVLSLLISSVRHRPTVLAMVLADTGMAAVYVMYLIGL